MPNSYSVFQLICSGEKLPYVSYSHVFSFLLSINHNLNRRPIFLNKKTAQEGTDMQCETESSEKLIS